MVWVRVHAQPRDVVVVGVYAPHFKRHGPTQKQFLRPSRSVSFPMGSVQAEPIAMQLARSRSIVSATPLGVKV